MTHPPQALMTHMVNVHLEPSTPAWKIVANARLTPSHNGRLFKEQEAEALTKLMASFYAYGRAHWKWTSSTSGPAANGGLVMGRATAAACGTFNQNFKWLAKEALQIDGLGDVHREGDFITAGEGIDSGWDGDLVAAGEPLIGLYKFSRHYWVGYHGKAYDVCFNRTSVDVVSKLSRPPADEEKKAGREVGELLRLRKPIPGVTGDAVRYLHEYDGNGWPRFEVITLKELAKLA